MGHADEIEPKNHQRGSLRKRLFDYDHVGSSGTGKNTTEGLVIGGGVDLHVQRIHFLPEIRYTRWLNTHFGGLSNQNQAEFLVGITF